MRDNPEGVYFHYLLWEDWRNGLYGSAHRETIIGDSVSLLVAPDVFLRVLDEVASEWPVATAQNLSNVYRNHQPWCGRAACSFEFGATVREVNTAWSELSHDQRSAANQIADRFTYEWRATNMLGQMRWPT